MGKTDEKTREKNKAYWSANKDDINRRRRERYKVKQAEKQAREKQYQEQAEAFLNDIEADTDIQNALRYILGGANPKDVLADYAKRKAETERDNGKE